LQQLSSLLAKVNYYVRGRADNIYTYFTRIAD